MRARLRRVGFRSLPDGPSSHSQRVQYKVKNKRCKTTHVPGLASSELLILSYISMVDGNTMGTEYANIRMRKKH